MPQLSSIPPKDALAGLLKLVKLSDEDVARLCSTLETVPVHPFRGEAVTTQISQVVGIPSSEARDSAAILLSLYFTLAQTKESLSSFAKTIIDALVDSAPTSEGLEAERWTSNLVKLLGVRSLYVRQNALSLLYENENLFTNARILTDLRPVFHESKSEQAAVENPSGFLLTHTLKIGYQNINGDGEIFIALDSDDLETLLAAIGRAKDKAAILSTIISKTELSILNTSR